VPGTSLKPASLVSIAHHVDATTGIEFDYPADWEVRRHDIIGEYRLMVGCGNFPNYDILVIFHPTPRLKSTAKKLRRLPHRLATVLAKTHPDMQNIKYSYIKSAPAAELAYKEIFQGQVKETRVRFTAMNPCGVLMASAECHEGGLERFALHLRLIFDSLKSNPPVEPPPRPADDEATDDAGLEPPPLETEKRPVPPQLTAPNGPGFRFDAVRTQVDSPRNLQFDHPLHWFIGADTSQEGWAVLAPEPGKKYFPSILIRICPEVPSHVRTLDQVADDYLAAIRQVVGTVEITHRQTLSHQGMNAIDVAHRYAKEAVPLEARLRLVQFDRLHILYVVVEHESSVSAVCRTQLATVVESVRPLL
jgi:hypothetical protein